MFNTLTVAERAPNCAPYCMQAVLMQTYDTSIIPNTLIRARKLPGAEYTVHRWQPTRAVSTVPNEFFKITTTLAEASL